MSNIIVIAKNTFRETVRDRILYAILGFAALFILFDLFMSRLALGDPVMIKSFGLAGIYIFGLIITIFLGSSIIYKEIERRTLYFVLAKPVTRGEVILGKFAGLFLAISLTVLLMAVIYLAVVFRATGTLDILSLAAIFFQLLEMALVAAVLIFFSAIAAPMTATLLAVMLIFIGHLLGSVLHNAQLIGGATYIMSLIFYYIFPNLEKFDLRNLVAHGIGVAPAAAFFALAYAALYSAILLCLASVLFNKREL